MFRDRLVALALDALNGTPAWRDEVELRIDAVLALDASEQEQVALIVIDLYESGLGRRGVPFGHCASLCARRCYDCRTEAVTMTAQAALRTLRRGNRCSEHRSWTRVFWFYHSGDCRPRHPSRTSRQLVRFEVRRLERWLRQLGLPPTERATCRCDSANARLA